MNETVTNGAILKNFGYIPALLIGLSPEAYAILGVFMLADLALGISRTLLLHGGHSFKSYKLTAGLVSKLVVMAVPLIVVWAGRGAGVDLTLVGQWSVGILVLSQAYSMLGHINAIRVGEERTEWDGVSWLLKRLRGGFEAMIIDGHNKEKP